MISLWFVSKSFKNNLHSQSPGIVTRRLCDLGVMIFRGCATYGYCSTSGYRYLEIATKKFFFGEYLCENKIFFENILGVTQGLIHEKTQSSKISCFCLFKSTQYGRVFVNKNGQIFLWSMYCITEKNLQKFCHRPPNFICFFIDHNNNLVCSG